MMNGDDQGAGRTRGLGKGLAALLGDNVPASTDTPAANEPSAERRVPVDRLKPSPVQPRRHFDDSEIESLAASIRANGILQPLLVRPAREDADSYEIVAGERRWRASQRAGQHEVPVIVRHMSDEEALELALVENLQREDLRPLEEASAFQQLVAEFGHTQDEVAQALGKSRSHVANTIRLLELPDAVKTLLDDGSLTAGHARALLNAQDPAALAAQVVQRGLNVRQTEALVRRAERKPTARPGRRSRKDPNIRDLEEDLTRRIGLKVEIEAKGDGGKVVMYYRTLEQLDELTRRFY